MAKIAKKDSTFSGNDDEGDEVKFTLEQEILLIQEVMSLIRRYWMQRWIAKFSS